MNPKFLRDPDAPGDEGNTIVDDLTVKADPPTPNLASADKFILKVDGKEVEMTREQVIAEAQKAKSLQQQSSQWGQERSRLEAEATVGRTLKAYRDNPNGETYKAFLSASGYPEAEIEQAMTDQGYVQQNQPTKPQGGEGVKDDLIKKLETRLAEVESILAGRENVTVTGLIRSGIENDPYMKRALEGLETEARDARLSFVTHEANRLANEYVQKLRASGKTWDPSEDRKVAEQVVAGAIAVAKKMALGAPTHIGRVSGDGYAAGGFVEPPKEVGLKDTSLSDLQAHIGRVIAHGIASSH